MEGGPGQVSKDERPRSADDDATPANRGEEGQGCFSEGQRLWGLNDGLGGDGPLQMSEAQDLTPFRQEAGIVNRHRDERRCRTTAAFGGCLLT